MSNNYYNGAILEKKVHILGNPLHKSRYELIKLYVNDALEYKRYESAHSCGSYLLIDNRNSLQIITSSGFTGGYLVMSGNNVYLANTLNQLLRINPISINMSSLLRYLSEHHTHMFPMSSIFNGVSVVPPFVHLSIDDGEIRSQKCYYIRTKTIAFHDVAEENNRIFNELPVEKYLMFSGGIDSLGLSLGINTRVNNITVNYGIGHHNSPRRASVISKMYNIETSVVSFKDIDISDILEQFKTDIINVYSPFNFVIKRSPQNSTVISGQNYDAMFGINMISLPIPYWLHLIWFKNIFKIVKYIAHNILFTDNYIRSRSVRYFVANTLNIGFKMKGKHKYYCDHTVNGIYLGLLSTGIPNIINKNSEKINKILDIEIKKILDIIDPDYPLQVKVSLFYFYYYSFNSVRISNAFNARRNYGVSFPAMYSPFLNTVLNRKRTWSTAFTPKRPLYQYVGLKTGVEYHKSYSKKSYYSEYSASKNDDTDVAYLVKIIQEYHMIYSSGIPALKSSINKTNVNIPEISKYIELFDVEDTSVLPADDLIIIVKMINLEILLQEINIAK